MSTVTELETRKGKALNLLESHADEYRLFYVELINCKDPTPQDIESFKVKRDLLSLKADAIHTQIKYLDELINGNKTE